MKTIIMSATILCVACSQSPAPRFPHTYASEEQDEWLETHCERKSVIDTNTDTFNDDMVAARANFAEVLSYAKPGTNAASMSVKTFACPSRPVWYGADSLDKPEDL